MYSTKPYQIMQTLEDPTFGADGTRETSYRVVFMVGKDGPFQERFTRADFTPIDVDARLRAFAQTIEQLRS